MKVTPSAVPGLAVHGPDTEEFRTTVFELFGGEPASSIRHALPYSVMVENGTERTLALLGIRFEMLGPKGRPFVVVHYADTLRNPEKSDLRHGARRIVCAEQEYTTLMMRGGGEPGPRGRMNLDNLRKMLGVKASVDCAAFDDGRFLGPDTNGAFDRLAAERKAETELIERVSALRAKTFAEVERVARRAAEDRADRGRCRAARMIVEGLDAGGTEEFWRRVAHYRCRIELLR